MFGNDGFEFGGKVEFLTDIMICNDENFIFLCEENGEIITEAETDNKRHFWDSKDCFRGEFIIDFFGKSTIHQICLIF